jgi:hypothetical protein
MDMVNIDLKALRRDLNLQIARHKIWKALIFLNRSMDVRPA